MIEPSPASASASASTSATATTTTSTSASASTSASNQGKSSQRDHQSHLLGRTSSMTGRGKSKRSPVPVQYGFSLVKGKSKHAMEDYHVAEFKQVKHGPHRIEVGLFAIFDGHMGHNVSSYLQRHLFDSILQQVWCSLLLSFLFFFEILLLIYLIFQCVFPVFGIYSSCK